MKRDQEIFDLIEREHQRQLKGMELIASENFVSDEVMQAMGSWLTNKYAEGYPGKRYYGGCEVVDEVETLAIERVKKLFGAEYANVQPHSGAQANAAVMLAVLKPGDTFMGLNLAHGGHLSHGSAVNTSGILYNPIGYNLNKETGRVDYDEMEKLALEHKPKLIIGGGSAYSREWDYKRMREIADREIDALTIAQIQDVIDRNASTYYTRKDMKTVLSHCYNLAIAEKQTTVNLAKYIKLPELEEKSPEPFTDADVKKLWEAYAKDHFVGFILTMIYTGMMPGELLKLKKDMIDFEKNEIVRGGIKTKKRKETPMVFPDFVAPVLHELCEESKSRVGNICCINKDNFYKRYYECLELAGVQKLPPYSCRHTTATALAMKNIDPFTIKEIMRHTKITTTQRYVHPDMKGMVDAVNQLQNESPE